MSTASEPVRDATARGAPLPAPSPGSTGRVRRQALRQGAVHATCALSALLPLSGLVAMLVVLSTEAIPAISYNGFGFFTRSVWNIGNETLPVSRAGGVTHLVGASYGSWPLIAGTLESSAIAIVVGLPIAVGAAVLVVEKLPRRLAAAVGVCLEVLAGIPSVVIGLWGLFSFGPFLADHLYPVLEHLPDVPVLDVFRGAFHANGQGLLTGGLVLAAMIVPIIAATTRDLLGQVPETTKEAATALGMTSTEAFFTVQARWVRAGIIGAAVLGLGRALGETIAIAIVSGSIPYLASNIYASMSTIAAHIVTQLDAAQGDPSGLAVYSIAELALVLFVITLGVNLGARMIVRRVGRGIALPLGARP